MDLCLASVLDQETVSYFLAPREIKQGCCGTTIIRAHNYFSLRSKANPFAKKEALIIASLKYKSIRLIADSG